MTNHKIYAIELPGGAEHGLTYFEGQSGKLRHQEIHDPSLGEFGDPRSLGWFMFEDTFASGCAELNRLGFTAQQIEVAIVMPESPAREDRDPAWFIAGGVDEG